MNFKRKIDKILLLVCVILVFSVAAVFLIQNLGNGTAEKSVIFVNDQNSVANNVLDTEAKDDEALLDIDLAGRHLPITAPRTIERTIPITDKAISIQTSTVNSTVASTTVNTTSLSDYEIFLNPPDGEHDVDLTLFVSPEDGLNLRSAATINSEVVTVIDHASPVRVIKVIGSWCEVRLYSGEQGFVKSEYLQVGRPETVLTQLSTDDDVQSTSAIPTSKITDNTSSSTTTTTTTNSTTTTTTTTATTTTTTSKKENPDVYSGFIGAGSNYSAQINFNKIINLGLIRRDPSRINSHYDDFRDNGDGTITVDGVSFAYDQKVVWFATHYDGVACSRAAGDDPVYNRNTASGIPAQRGLVAMKLVENGGLPRGTVIFVKGYGIAVVADVGSFRADTQLDLCYDADECATKNIRPWGRGSHEVYILSMP